MDETGWRIGDPTPQWEKRQTGRWNEMGAGPSTHIYATIRRNPVVQAANARLAPLNAPTN